jgi:glycosyltransferase involved in cell wall biosynthesis
MNPDVVIWYHTFGWFPNPWPSVLFAVNVETDRLAREGTVRPWQLKFVRSRETNAARRASLVLALSEPDQRSLAELSGRDVAVVSASVQAAPEVKSQHGPLRSVCFVGSFDYRPNVEAAERSARLNPLLRERAGIAELVVAGRHADRLPSWVKQAEGLTILSDVPNMSAFLITQDLLLVPLTNGGGVRIKILEAFAAGIPVVSTAVGAEGLVAIPGRHIALGETDGELVDAVRSFSSPDVRSAVASAALDLWKHHYSSDAVAETLDSAIRAAHLGHRERHVAVR